jgi:prepilin-type N-terminal cleavage/methylation domain-containing protein
VRNKKDSRSSWTGKMKIKKMILLINEKKGFTLIEAMIALAIFSIGILGVAAMQVIAINGNGIARIQTDATGKTVDWTERLQGREYTSENTHNDLVNGDHGPVTDGAYEITWNVSNGPINETKLIQVRITPKNTVRGRPVVANFIKSRR